MYKFLHKVTNLKKLLGRKFDIRRSIFSIACKNLTSHYSIFERLPIYSPLCAFMYPLCNIIKSGCTVYQSVRWIDTPTAYDYLN